MLVVADHAGRSIPAGLNQLGLEDWVLERHVAWDIGSDLLAMHLAEQLDAPAVLAGFSRLLIDPNRQLDDPTAIPAVSDGIAIPGNQDLDEQARKLRIDSFHGPYHRAIEERLAEFTENNIVPAFIAVHTCTPVFANLARPWHIGIMWDRDGRLAVPMMENLKTVEGVCVGDNEPYSGRHPHDFTIDHHAEPAGLPHVGIEVRQDLVSNSGGARRWARVLADSLRETLADSGVYRKFSEA